MNGEPFCYEYHRYRTENYVRISERLIPGEIDPELQFANLLLLTTVPTDTVKCIFPVRTADSENECVQ